jgi:hypothetical protein
MDFFDILKIITLVLLKLTVNCRRSQNKGKASNCLCNPSRDHIINEKQDGYQNLVEEALVAVLNMLMEKGLQLININPEQCRGQGTTLFNLDGTLDEI